MKEPSINFISGLILFGAAQIIILAFILIIRPRGGNKVANRILAALFSPYR